MLEEEREHVSSGIREISPGWDEKDIRAFDCSIGARKKVQQIETELAKAEQDHLLLRAEILSVKKEQEAAEAESEARPSRSPDLVTNPPAAGMISCTASLAIRSLRNLVAEKEKIDAKTSIEEARLNDKRRQKEEY